MPMEQMASGREKVTEAHHSAECEVRLIPNHWLSFKLEGRIALCIARAG
jgi:hypothetical protein